MSFCSDLNSEHAIPQVVQFELGPGPLPMAFVNNKHATATVSLLGGQVLTYQRHGEQPTLWVSRKADYEVGKAIRGGVPVIFPWFGGHPKLAKVPSHGLVRNRLWSVVSTQALDDGVTELVLAFKDDPDTRALWPYTFRAEVTITIGATLAISLTVTNTGVRAFQWSGALHSYFSVGSITDASVQNLDGVTYQDKVHGGESVQLGDVLFSEETDRVYLTDAASTPIVDANWQRTIDVQHGGHDSVVVWNPGKTAVKHDLTKASYSEFVCVETGIGCGASSASDMLTLAPNQTHMLTTTVRTESNSRSAS